jgi:hypothetical protein
MAEPVEVAPCQDVEHLCGRGDESLAQWLPVTCGARGKDERLPVLRHLEVFELFRRKDSDDDRWPSGTQRVADVLA